MSSSSLRRCVFSSTMLFAAACVAGTAGAQTFAPTAHPGYTRGFSAQQATYDSFIAQGVVDVVDFPNFPMKPRGSPGVVLFDFDGDGDLDVYVTNGPGVPNSLLKNQLVEVGTLTFVDVAIGAGVDATSQDSTGACFGDTDNDGDHDLLVLGQNQPNRFFENLGNGTFVDVTAASDIGGSSLGATSCSMGDVDGDGLLDVVVSNTFDWATLQAYMVEPFALNHPNNLYVNAGDNTFADVSAASGIQNVQTISFATAMVDYDQDGDVDIMFADSQGTIPTAANGGVNRGALRVYRNDGTGNFTDVTATSGTGATGGWMGLAYADLDCDRSLDVFGSNFGDYLFELIGVPNAPGDNETRWFLGSSAGTFTDTGAANGFGTLPFGWGTTTFDYDNDGDFDLIWHGGFELSVWQDVTNPGAILRNDGCGSSFSRDAIALAGSTNHSRRAVQGVAVGDLNGDGYPDVVTAANKVSPDPIPLIPLTPLGGPFDDVAFYTPNFLPIVVDPMLPPDMFVWAGFPFQPGDLSIELNSGAAGNGFVVVRTLGTKGLTSQGAANRDGIGAVVTVTRQGGAPSSRPVLGGASFASQDALATNFGLGLSPSATVEVLWPGGTRNRLYGVPAGTKLRFPEIPCSIDTTASFATYLKCVTKALVQLKSAGVISAREKAHLLSSAVRAYREERGPGSGGGHGAQCPHGHGHGKGHQSHGKGHGKGHDKHCH